MSEIKMPDQVKIGFFDYSIKQDNEMTDMGSTGFDCLEIKINSKYQDQVIKETLLHECLHALLYDTFLLEDELEEKVIRVLSPKLMQLFHSNESLVNFLLK